MNDVRWLNQHQQTVWRDFLRASVRLVDRLDDELQAAFGLSLADYEILVHLSEAPERRLRMNVLANEALMSRSRLSHRVNRLADEGLLARVPCPEDGRGTFAVLTEQGYALVVAAAPLHVTSVRRYLVDTVDERTFAAFGRMSAAIADALDSPFEPDAALSGPSSPDAGDDAPADRAAR